MSRDAKTGLGCLFGFSGVVSTGDTTEGGSVTTGSNSGAGLNGNDEVSVATTPVSVVDSETVSLAAWSTKDSSMGSKETVSLLELTAGSSGLSAHCSAPRGQYDWHCTHRMDAAPVAALVGSVACGPLIAASTSVSLIPRRLLTAGLIRTPNDLARLVAADLVILDVACIRTSNPSVVAVALCVRICTITFLNDSS